MNECEPTLKTFYIEVYIHIHKTFKLIYTCMACIIDLWKDSSISIILVIYSSFFTQLTAQPKNNKSMKIKWSELKKLYGQNNLWYNNKKKLRTFNKSCWLSVSKIKIGSVFLMFRNCFYYDLHWVKVTLLLLQSNNNYIQSYMNTVK